MNRHALQVVQFHEALDVVARYASSALGAGAVRALRPADARAWIDEELHRVDQLAAFLLRADDWHLGAIPDLRAALRLLAMAGSTLDGPVLRDFGVLLRSSRLAYASLDSRAREYPLLLQLGRALIRDEPLEQVLHGAVGDDGEVRDSASRELARLRRELRSGRSRIVERLERYAASLPERIQVADVSVSLRDGRYVIAIRREGRAEVGGIVHDESATGSTLFVEPPLAIDLMNQLRELELAEAREVQRILRELTERLRPRQPELQSALEALVQLDSLLARARYTLQSNGRRPEVLARGEPEYRVVNARHPLLLAAAENAVVPFDLLLERGERTLLVSGPNTGGKTVLLKAIGLISALAQAGVIPPVGEGTRLPLFGEMFADIGDEQSIEASLSTFSAHLRNLREVLEHADAESLVLIDEIGSGTDPVEGSALADAVLRTLTARGALTVATTHLGQLKLLASEEPGVVNASLQFDAVALQPTYRLLKGIPGRSYGLAIARRLGSPEAVLQRADASISGVERDATQLLAELEEKDRELAAALSAAEAARREVEALQEELRAREQAVRERERTAERRARQQARDLLLHARQEVESAIRAVREAGERGDRAAVEQAAREARRRVEAQARVQEAKAPRPARDGDAEPIALGSWVRVAASGAEGTVVELRDGRAVVEVSGVRVQVSAQGLEPAARPDGALRPVLRGGWNAPDLEVSPEVDLRGLHVAELIPKLQTAIDAAVQADLQSLRIIHGKGTGAAREAVVELVRADPRVVSFRPGRLGEGGAGVTVAELR
jgi:DNA mismatch repair protein MutS2